MSVENHYEIVVSCWNKEKLAIAHEKAKTIFPFVSPLVPHIINGGASFLVPADGSKEGWPENQAAEERRAEFIRWLEETRYEDGSSPFRWAEVELADNGCRFVQARAQVL